jgi:hypothetical protein
VVLIVHGQCWQEQLERQSAQHRCHHRHHYHYWLRMMAMTGERHVG